MIYKVVNQTKEYWSWIFLWSGVDTRIQAVSCHPLNLENLLSHSFFHQNAFRYILWVNGHWTPHEVKCNKPLWCNHFNILCQAIYLFQNLNVGRKSLISFLNSRLEKIFNFNIEFILICNRVTEMNPLEVIIYIELQMEELNVSIFHIWESTNPKSPKIFQKLP